MTLAMPTCGDMCAAMPNSPNAAEDSAASKTGASFEAEMKQALPAKTSDTATAKVTVKEHRGNKDKSETSKDEEKTTVATAVVAPVTTPPQAFRLPLSFSVQMLPQDAQDGTVASETATQGSSDAPKAHAAALLDGELQPALSAVGQPAQQHSPHQHLAFSAIVKKPDLPDKTSSVDAAKPAAPAAPDAVSKAEPVHAPKENHSLERDDNAAGKPLPETQQKTVQPAFQLTEAADTVPVTKPPSHSSASAAAPSGRVTEVDAAAAPASPAARDFSIRVNGPGEAQATIRVRESGGEVRVAVHSPNLDLTKDLRSELNGLTGRLDSAGVKAQVWHPGQAAASDNAPDRRDAQPDGSSQSRENARGGGSGEPEADQQKRRSRWIDEMEKLNGYQ